MINQRIFLLSHAELLPPKVDSRPALATYEIPAPVPAEIPETNFERNIGKLINIRRKRHLKHKKPSYGGGCGGGCGGGGYYQRKYQSSYSSKAHEPRYTNLSIRF